MDAKEEKQCQSSNMCWMCEKRIDNDDKKVRNHCHITGKFEAQLTGVVTQIFN